MNSQQDFNILEEDCFNRHVLDIVVNRWTGLIFYALSSGPKRYNQLRRMVEGISQTMLTNTVRKLERNGLIRRQIYPEVPPRVEYSLTSLGETLIPIFEQIYQWTGDYMAEIQLAQQRYDEDSSEVHE